MKWNNVIDEVKSMRTEEAKSFVESRATYSYQLIDVRQPEEYAKSHLPGATLIPLGDLVAGQGDIDKGKPVLVYCRSGSRSQAAAQWLVGQEFETVWNVEGGISTWMGDTAFGHFELNLNLLKPEAEFPDALSMAYAMEEGLRQFYMQLANETPQETYKKLYRKLASFEVEHKQYLSDNHSIGQRQETIRKEAEEHHGQIMEGGGYADATLIKALAGTESVQDVFALAMAFETQAFDFYVRLSRHAGRPQVKKFFLEMADEEKKHLAFVSKEMDRYLNQEQDGGTS
ncbi:MAG: sulfurtransferase [Proteobacteria bacterium]|nr:sulfurtransferase [Pseudomonadota bacterium]